MSSFLYKRVTSHVHLRCVHTEAKIRQNASSCLFYLLHAQEAQELFTTAVNWDSSNVSSNVKDPWSTLLSALRYAICACQKKLIQRTLYNNTYQNKHSFERPIYSFMLNVAKTYFPSVVLPRTRGAYSWEKTHSVPEVAGHLLQKSH